MPLRTEITFTLNGRATTLGVPVDMNAAQMLRELLDLTGTKIACAEGECGACTIQVDGATVNGCLMFAADCDGREIVTIEGLQDDMRLHPLQQAFVDQGAIQCGYCMPGMIMQSNYLISKHGRPSEDAIRRGLEGNVCRCTGYAKVIDAINATADAVQAAE
jgi:carbon-monoxide dehydrogenase small subunit